MNDYVYIICPFFSAIFCQVLKFTFESITKKKLDWARLFNGSGGMPSTHTTFAFSLTSLIGFNLGFNTPLFAVAIILSVVVSYDAIGVRMESGKQAVIINDIAESFFKGSAKKGYKELKEQLGHKPLEVVMGIILGIIMGYLFSVYF